MATIPIRTLLDDELPGRESQTETRRNTSSKNQPMASRLCQLHARPRRRKYQSRRRNRARLQFATTKSSRRLWYRRLSSASSVMLEIAGSAHSPVTKHQAPQGAVRVGKHPDRESMRSGGNGSGWLDPNPMIKQSRKTVLTSRGRRTR